MPTKICILVLYFLILHNLCSHFQDLWKLLWQALGQSKETPSPDCKVYYGRYCAYHLLLPKVKQWEYNIGRHEWQLYTATGWWFSSLKRGKNSSDVGKAKIGNPSVQNITTKLSFFWLLVPVQHPKGSLDKNVLLHTLNLIVLAIKGFLFFLLFFFLVV